MFSCAERESLRKPNPTAACPVKLTCETDLHRRTGAKPEPWLVKQRRLTAKTPADVGKKKRPVALGKVLKGSSQQMTSTCLHVHRLSHLSSQAKPRRRDSPLLPMGQLESTSGFTLTRAHSSPDSTF